MAYRLGRCSLTRGFEDEVGNTRGDGNQSGQQDDTQYDDEDLQAAYHFGVLKTGWAGLIVAWRLLLGVACFSVGRRRHKVGGPWG